MNATIAPSPLTAVDRCDRCGARAYIRVTLPSGELLFCAHHGRTHAPALTGIALNIQDETHALDESRSDSPAEPA